MEKKSPRPVDAAVNLYLGTLYRKLRTTTTLVSKADIDKCKKSIIQANGADCENIDASALYYSNFQDIIVEVGGNYFDKLSLGNIYSIELSLHSIFSIMQALATPSVTVSEKDISIRMGNTLFSSNVNGINTCIGERIIHKNRKSDDSFVANSRLHGLIVRTGSEKYVVDLDCNSVMNCTHSISKMNLLSMICVAQCSKKATELVLSAIGTHSSVKELTRVTFSDKIIWRRIKTEQTSKDSLSKTSILSWERAIREPFEMDLRFSN